MKAKHKSLKQVRLSDPSGVRDVQLGHHASSERPPRNFAKADTPQTHPDTTTPFDDVKARQKRYGFPF